MATCPAIASSISAASRGEADSKRGSELAGGGFTTGVILIYGGTTIMPQLSVDGLALREEGYSEANGGPGLDLQRAALLRQFAARLPRRQRATRLDFGDFYIQPEARLGLSLRSRRRSGEVAHGFPERHRHGRSGHGHVHVIGPDPERGNIVAGVTVPATTGTWSMGLNFDYIRGNGGSVSQVGTLSLLGKI